MEESAVVSEKWQRPKRKMFSTRREYGRKEVRLRIYSAKPQGSKLTEELENIGEYKKIKGSWGGERQKK